MEKSLKVFEQEFYERLSKGEISLEKIGTVPEVYIKSEQIQKKIGNFQKDLDAAKIYSEKANSKFLKLRRAKENEKIRHRRVQQEKQLLIKEIDKMKKIYKQDNDIYKELSKKYGEVTVKSAIFDTQIGAMKLKIENLDDQILKLKTTLAESKTHLENEDNVKDKSLMKEELKGSKIIQWTPFPIIPKELSSTINTNFPAVSQRMNVFKSFPGHLNGVTSIDFNPKKAIIGTASDDKTWKLWKFPTGELLMHGEGHKDWISCISFHPNGILLATCGGDAAIKLWNILEEKCVYTIIDHAEPVWKCKFHFCGDFMLTSCLDHTIRLYDLNNYKARMSYRAHLDSVNSINWVPMSNNFVSGSADKTVSLWDMRSNICAQTYYGHNNAINCCAVEPTGNVLASCDADGIVKFWDLRTVRELSSLDECKQAANCLCFDRTGDQLAVGYDDSNIRLFKTGQKYETMFKGHDDAVLDLMYDPNNVLLISASADRTFKIWQ
jgi:WD40 repeat protein